MKPSFDDERQRIAEMLKSVDPTLDYPNDNRSKAQVMRALLGDIDVKNDAAMLALCECGWRGTMLNCWMVRHDNGGWDRLAGRRGLHWLCPKCNAVVWKYYNVIS